jgi:hypothetical protein
VLSRVEFRFDRSCDVIVRRKKEGDFPWREGVKGFTLVMLDYFLSTKDGKTNRYKSEGKAEHSPQASLGQRLNHLEDSDWLAQMLRRKSAGTDKHVVRSIFSQGFNIAGKNKNETIEIGINTDFLPRDCIQISWERRTGSSEVTARDLEVIRRSLDNEFAPGTSAFRKNPRATDYRDYSLDELREEYQKLRKFSDHLHAAEVGIVALKKVGRDAYLEAKWAGWTASAYRKEAQLTAALYYYEQAEKAIELAFDRQVNAVPDFWFTRWKIRFGTILTRDIHKEAEYQVAYKKLDNLLQQVSDTCSAHRFSSHDLGRINTGRGNILRQQAELLRLQGYYQKAISKIRKAASAYSKWDVDELQYCQISRADSLRQLGHLEESLRIYASLERVAEDESKKGLLCTVLWRAAEASKALHGCLRNAETETAKLQRAIPKRNRPFHFAQLFAHLTAAGAALVAKRFKSAKQHAAAAIQAEKLSERNLRLEYAHAKFLLGEAYRRQRKTSKALKELRQANSCYLSMPARWGIVRTSIAICLCGETVTLPKQFEKGLEGEDARLWEDFKQGRREFNKRLVVNLL